MRYAADHKARTRGKLLQAAGEALRTAGPDGLGVAAVTAGAGLTHGAFYAHFASKEALVAETALAASEVMRQRFARRVEGLGPEDAFRAQIDFYLSPAHRDGAATGCLLPSVSSDAARGPQGLKGAYAQVVEAMTQIMQGLLADLGHGEPDLARSMVAEMVGALSLARAVDDPAASDAILAASRAALLRRAGLA